MYDAEQNDREMVQRILQRMGEKNIKRKELTSSMGLTLRQVQRLLDVNNPANLKATHIRTLAQTLDVTTDWLILGDETTDNLKNAVKAIKAVLQEEQREAPWNGIDRRQQIGEGTEQ